MAARGRPSAKEKEKEDAKALGVHRVPENQKREVYERVRRAMEAKTGVCTSHKVGSSSWDKNEQRVLEDGLRYYPHDQHSNMLIYIRIAAGLPKKTVRDVAHHLRHMQPLGQLLSCSIVRHVFPGAKHISGVAADAVLRTPGIRLLYSWMGIRKAGRKSILDMFEEDINVAVVVGGIAEMFMVSNHTETLYLKKRKNFTKISIEAGADIVPVYFFGNSLLHGLVGGEGADNWLCRLSRKFKTALVLFYGRFGTPVPRRKELKMVAGRPIAVVQSNSPSDEYVDALHAELLKRVEELYYKHRPDWETRTLVIT